MGVGQNFRHCHSCCAHGCWGVGHVDMWTRLAVVPEVPLWCWCCVLVWVWVWGGVVIGCGVGVWVNGSPMAVASRLIGVRGVWCGCGHCPTWDVRGVGVGTCGNVGRTSHIATGMGRPLMTWDRGRGCGSRGIEWCKHSISEKEKFSKTKNEKRKTKKSILRRFKGIKILWWYSCSFSW